MLEDSKLEVWLLERHRKRIDFKNRLEVRIKKILSLLITVSLGLLVFGQALAELSPEAQRLFDLAKAAQVGAHQSNPNGNIDQAAWRNAADAAEAAVIAAPLEAAPLRLRAQVYTEIGFWIRAESAWRDLQTGTQNHLTRIESDSAKCCITSGTARIKLVTSRRPSHTFTRPPKTRPTRRGSKFGRAGFCSNVATLAAHCHTGNGP